MNQMWEYEELEVEDRNNYREWRLAKLNEMGNQRWELVMVMGRRYTFKRLVGPLVMGHDGKLHPVQEG